MWEKKKLLSKNFQNGIRSFTPHNQQIFDGINQNTRYDSFHIHFGWNNVEHLCGRFVFLFRHKMNVGVYRLVLFGGVNNLCVFVRWFFVHVKRNQLALSSLKNFWDFSRNTQCVTYISHFPPAFSLHKFHRKSISHINVIIHNFNGTFDSWFFLFCSSFYGISLRLLHYLALLVEHFVITLCVLNIFALSVNESSSE